MNFKEEFMNKKIGNYTVVSDNKFIAICPECISAGAKGYC